MLNIKNTTDGYLKNIEIKGNTIQDASNLADIRSVGDKVEGQELYEIDVLSRGKNLNSGFELGDLSTYDGTLVTSSTKIRSIEFIKIDILNSYNIHRNGINEGFNVYCYNDAKDFLGLKTKSNGLFTSSDFLEGTKYVKFVKTSTDTTNIQLEEGAVVTPYEPYVEDKLTILSPVQLEKVGDVRDRIICKDGVWGVEKNVKDFVVPTNLGWNEYKTNIKEGCFGCYTNNLDLSDFSDLVKNKENYAISEKFTVNTGSLVASSTTNGIYIRPDLNGIYLKGESSSFKALGVSLEGSLIKYPTNTSEFIPLPHDQQVKLRTFAGQTNIYFETEIEPTLKAQVPKSLGATVNTHTEQIGNLSKELDRVKKLEESTVSTVTTESDFTTVEETANGYFEDVKIEGKTLVNIAKHKGDWKLQSDDGTQQSQYKFDLIKSINVGDKFTIIVNLKDIVDTTNGQNTVYIRFGHHDVNKISNFPLKKQIIYCVTYDGSYNAFDIRMPLLNIQQGCRATIESVIVLEGDHTQKPPSYFEGLMSVGEDVDEVSVESVNDGNLFEGIWVTGGVSGSTGADTQWTNYIKTSNFVELYKNIQYSFNVNVEGAVSNSFVYIYDKNKNFVRSITFSGKLNGNFTLYSKEQYCKFAVNGTSLTIDSFKGFKLCIGNNVNEYNHQLDKKPLLYYNNETQTWEKPILRQWDSIEKHSDGKYYYHKRSGEVVLNGSENWKLASGDYPKDTSNSYRVSGLVSHKSGNYESAKTSINNLGFASENYLDVIQRRISEFGIGINGVDIAISIPNSKLNIANVEGFKVWLQANPTTVVYQLAEEKVYECTNIDLITYENETNYVVNCGAIAPKSTLKVHNNISNVVKILQEKVSLLESNVKASQEVQDMMILETDMRMLDIELALMEFMPMTLNLGGSNMLRSATYFNFLKNHIINETYEKEYLENVMNKYLATGRIDQDEYDELYKMLYPPVYDIELPIEY